MRRATRSPRAEPEPEIDEIAGSAAELKAPRISFDANEIAYALMHRQWTRLALVAPEFSAKTWGAATSVVRACKRIGHTAIAVNALKLDEAWASGIAHLIGRTSDPAPSRSSRFVLAVDSPADNPLAMNILAACDAVLVVLELEKTELPRARKTIDYIGRDRILGAVLIRD